MDYRIDRIDKNSIVATEYDRMGIDATLYCSILKKQ